MNARNMHASPQACGTCRNAVENGEPVEHEQCAARAVLLPAPDQPMYEDLVDLTDEQRTALPARFHTPVFDGLGQPNAWLCQVCWGDGWVAQWPCNPAQLHGAQVFSSEGVAADIATELTTLRAEVAALKDERHATNEALSDACEQIAALESDLGGAMARIAELEAHLARDAEMRHLMDPLDHALEALAPRTTTETSGSAL